MLGRLLAVGVAWLAAIALFAVLLQSSGQPTPRGPSWRVVRANSAHHAMVMEVEADHLADAPQIAAEIVEPLGPRGYEEVLIYIYPTPSTRSARSAQAGPAPDAPVRRFQWTPHGGFVEKDY